MSLHSSMLARLRPVALRPVALRLGTLRPGAPRDRAPHAAGGWAVWAVIVATAAAYVWAHAVHGLGPRSSVPPDGWWHWTDQGRYVRAALAWASGDLDPARHWYLPGYPLLGAAFARLTPAQPFYLPDLAGSVAAAWLFSRLAARLMQGPDSPTAPPPAAPRTDRRDGPARAIPRREGPRSGPSVAAGLGAAVFLATTVLSPRALDARPMDHLPAPPLETGQTVAFDGAEEAYRLDGWSPAEPGGCWTGGPSTELRVRPTGPMAPADPVLASRARAFVPGRRHGVRVAVYAGDERVAV